MDNKIRGNSVVWIIIIIAIAWGIFSLFKKDDDYSTQIMQEHPNYESYKETKDCSVLEPENPYDEGSGHYAGFEWGQDNNVSSCDGNSTSFIEGCEDYLTQENAYDVCISK